MSGSTEAGSPQTEGGANAPTDTDTGATAETSTAAPIEATAETSPPEPEPEHRPEDEAAERDALLTHGSRAIALAALIGAAIVAWTQLAFRAPWLDELLLDNTAGPELRK